VISWKKCFAPIQIMLVLGLMLSQVFCIPLRYDQPSCDFAQNAAWVSVHWTANPPDESAIQALAESMQARQIAFLFVYTAYLKADGTFSNPPNHAENYAGEFAYLFRKHNQNTKLLAWVGVPLKNDRPLGIAGWVDLAEQSERSKVVAYASEIVPNFDGIHLNVETVANRNPDFLQLLTEVKTAIGDEKLLSIAGAHWSPDWLNAVPFLQDFRWTTAYYRQIALQVDQIATMTYDSRAFLPEVYRFWMREQVKGITQSLQDSDTQLLIGISVSQEGTNSHRLAAERLADGLAGLCASGSALAGVVGVALYADWDFSRQDELVWQKWLEK